MTGRRIDPVARDWLARRVATMTESKPMDKEYEERLRGYLDGDLQSDPPWDGMAWRRLLPTCCGRTTIGVLEAR